MVYSMPARRDCDSTRLLNRQGTPRFDAALGVGVVTLLSRSPIHR